MAKKRKKYQYPLNYYAPSGDPDQLRKVVKARFSIITSLELLQMLEALIEEHPQNKPLLTLLFLLTERLTYGEYGIAKIDEVFEKEIIPLAQKIEDISATLSTTEITKNIINRIIPEDVNTQPIKDEIEQLKKLLEDANIEFNKEDKKDEQTIKDLIESSKDEDDWVEKITEILDKTFEDNEIAEGLKSRLNSDEYQAKKIEDDNFEGYYKFISLIFNDEIVDDKKPSLFNISDINAFLHNIDDLNNQKENFGNHETDSEQKPKEDSDPKEESS